MALALYRKYRPASFAEVVGQEHVTEPLRTALAAGRISHAYLFSGPRGCGKTSSARILARSLNCESGPTPDPCGVCPSCIALAPEGSGNIDVTELDAASHNGVDDARELRDRAFYAPAESRYRVFILDEAHMITTQGFNALLKIVEEPPEHLIFVFATTDPDKVLPTIRSRTHHYPFRLIPPGTLRGLLERICAAEDVTVAPAALPLVIRAGGGSARDSLSILDQLLAGAGPEGVTYERAVALLGVTDVALIDDTVDALAALDGAAVFEAVDRLVEAGHDPRRFSADLLERLRDLMLIQAVPDAAARGLVNTPDDEASRMADQASRLGAASLSRYAEILHSGLTEMRGATAPRLLLELLCARMLLPAASVDDAAMLERLERMERRIDIAPPAAERGGNEPVRQVSPRPAVQPAAGPDAPARPAASADPEPAAAAEPARAPDSGEAAAGAAQVSDSELVASGAIDAVAVRRVWPEILSAAKDASRSTGALLMNAQVKALDAGTLVLTINSAPLARRLSEQRNTDVIGAALRTVLGVDWRVRCEHDDGSAGVGAAGGAPRGGSSAAGPPGGDSSGGGSTDGGSTDGGSPAGRSPVGGSSGTGVSRGGSAGGASGGGRYQRPAAQQYAAPPRRNPSRSSEPLPPEPPPEDEEGMLAEADGSAVDLAPRRDPEEVAIELLAAQLGARAVDDRR